LYQRLLDPQMRADRAVRLPAAGLHGRARLYGMPATAASRSDWEGIRDQSDLGLREPRACHTAAPGRPQAMANLPELRARPAELALQCAERRRDGVCAARAARWSLCAEASCGSVHWLACVSGGWRRTLA